MKHFAISVLGLTALIAECFATTGLIDTTFVPAGKGRVWTIEDAPNGGVYVARNTLKRFNSDGTEDTRFVCPIVAEGMVANLRMVFAGADGSLLVAGTFAIDSQPAFTARVLSDGAIDPSYHRANFGPAIPAAIVTAGAVDAAGRLLLAGPFHVVDGHSVSYLTRLLPDGRWDETFTPPALSGVPAALGVLPSGQIVVAGGTGVMLLKPDGSPDNSAATYTGMSDIGAVAISSTGRIAVGGDSRVVMLREDLTEDTAFASDFRFQLGVDDLRFDPAGRLVAAGIFAGFPAVFGVVRFLPNGATDSSWARLGGTDGRIERVRLSQSGDVYVSGRFATIQGAARAGVARLHGANSGAVGWVNTSARATIRDGEPLIAGFFVNGDQPIQVLVRAVGPGLAQFGVDAPLPHPKFVVYSGSTPVLEASGWSDTDEMRSIQSAAGAFPLPSNSTDSVAMMVLPPGAYTVIVTGQNGEAGAALCEVYRL
ncbi:hypothetical protein [Opitutus sp. ER46]|uniref:hypothetical protein n=1 Tax=Opitutus sp. ER46 TaxID=2161864 RepID=UPI000D318258|nr:hypothetical protein [Opitutus sp. ER46]PTX99047.1 hypothetical protein DB354_03260 [Opitutus sp. ER46]